MKLIKNNLVSKSAIVFKTVTSILAGFAAGILSMLLYGVSISFLWKWFIVPLGVLPLSILHAYGILLVMRALQSNTPSTKDERDDKQKATDSFSMGLVTPVLLMLIGWIVKTLAGL